MNLAEYLIIVCIMLLLILVSIHEPGENKTPRYQAPFTLVTTQENLAALKKVCKHDDNCMDIMTFEQLPECFGGKE